MWLEPGTLVELDEHVSHHGRQLTDDFLAVVLNTYGGTVAAGVRVHARNKLEGERKGRGGGREEESEQQKRRKKEKDNGGNEMNGRGKDIAERLFSIQTIHVH